MRAHFFGAGTNLPFSNWFETNKTPSHFCLSLFFQFDTYAHFEVNLFFKKCIMTHAVRAFYGHSSMGLVIKTKSIFPSSSSSSSSSSSCPGLCLIPPRKHTGFPSSSFFGGRLTSYVFSRLPVMWVIRPWRVVKTYGQAMSILPKVHMLWKEWEQTAFGKSTRAFWSTLFCGQPCNGRNAPERK